MKDRPVESLDEFGKVPSLTRELYQANFDSIQAKSIPEGMSPLGKGSFTSGTSGVPIKVLKTNRDALWWNALTPFIRYEILDDVTLAGGPCPCGRGLPLWTCVEGRAYPMLRLTDGRRKSSMGIVLGLRQAAGMHQFQMIQRAVGRAIVRVVPNADWTPAHGERIREVLHREFESSIRVDIEETTHIERPTGGKLRLVVVEVE